MNLPHSPQTEAGLLGAILQNGELINQAAASLEPEDFFLGKHRAIYAAMRELLAHGKSIELVSLKDCLLKSGRLDLAGGVSGVAMLVEGMPIKYDISSWIDTIRKDSIVRRVVHAGESITQRAPGAETSDAAVDLALGEILEVAHRAKLVGGFGQPVAVAKDALKLLESLTETQGGVAGLHTGIAGFDIATGGMLPQQLFVFAGRPGMGKTAAALCVAEEVVLTGGKVAFFSQEMSKEELTMRRILIHAEVSLDRIRRARADEADAVWAKVSRATGIVQSPGLYIDDTPALTVTQIRARARRLQAEQGALSLVIVDYLQLCRAEHAKNRQEEVAEVARGLKNLAKELRVPVLALSQLNRQVEGRSDKRPTLSDLRESGEIEQSADVIVFLYREAAYDSLSESEEAEWIVGKLRNGKAGTIKVRFHAELMKFEDTH